jgi:hypothetical protein
MACAFPTDGAAGEFADRLGRELGPDGWFEAAYQRDIWYATLVHFTNDIRDRQRLIDFVAERRQLDLGSTTIGSAELVTFRYNGRQPIRRSLARAEFSASSPGRGSSTCPGC